jgi:hypothetical protein
MDVNQQLSTAEAEDPSTSCIESTSSDTCEMSSDCCGSMPFLEVANQVTEVPYVASVMMRVNAYKETLSRRCSVFCGRGQ